MDESFAIEARGITKTFPGCIALSHVDLSITEGEVRALLGENGAGKSTLIKILSGAYRMDEGELWINGNQLSHLTPRQARSHGIAVIHQELNLIPELSIAENLFLGRETVTGYGKIKWRELHRKAEELLKQVHLQVNPRTKISELSVAQQQMVEIAKALSADAKILIMDEPTDVLTARETAKLFEIIRDLKSKKKTIIYITHRLAELKEVCDSFTILRDGKLITSGKIADYNEKEIIGFMVGRSLNDQFPYTSTNASEIVMKAHNYSKHPIVNNVDFHVKRGEVLGLYGLVGSGRTELAKLIYGAEKADSGELFIEDNKVLVKNPSHAIRNGIYYISENRKAEGIIPEGSIKDNMTLSSINRFLTKYRRINVFKEKKAVNDYIGTLSIKTPNMYETIRNLSGGNQQKVLLARSMLINPKILILDEPTRGVDIGAKHSIYKVIDDLKISGVAIIVISSEIPEIMGICDRVAVMYGGKIVETFERSDISEQKIVQAAFGYGKEEVI